MGEERDVVPLNYTYAPALPLVPTASVQAQAGLPRPLSVLPGTSGHVQSPGSKWAWSRLSPGPGRLLCSELSDDSAGCPF